jgi:PAS domain S-box-containing protein
VTQTLRVDAEQRDAEPGPEPLQGGSDPQMASLVLSSASDAISGVDPQLSVVAFNPAAERLFGYPAREVIGRSAHMLVPPKLYDAVDRLKVSMRDSPPFELETRARHRDGHQIDVHLSLAPMRTRAGQLRGACLVIRDITDRKERRRMLATHLARLRELSVETIRTENRRMAGRLDAVSALLAALNARDRYTADHSRSVVALSVAVAREMQLAAETVDEVEQVALLHDLGKVGIPDSILQKPGPLSEEEWELMRQHPVIGAQIVSSVGSLAHLAGAVRAEHERWDGTGYPDRLAREAIPIASRITLTCDAYHAMTSDRPYRRAMSPRAAFIELRLCAGSQFDPAVVEALVRVLR